MGRVVVLDDIILPFPLGTEPSAMYTYHAAFSMSQTLQGHWGVSLMAGGLVAGGGRSDSIEGGLR